MLTEGKQIRHGLGRAPTTPKPKILIVRQVSRRRVDVYVSLPGTIEKSEINVTIDPAKP